MNRETAERGAFLANIATTEVDTGEQMAHAYLLPGTADWGISRPSSSSLSMQTRWRSMQLVALHMGRPTRCFPCWEEAGRRGRRDGIDAQRTVLAECCGMIGCPGPLSPPLVDPRADHQEHEARGHELLPPRQEVTYRRHLQSAGCPPRRQVAR